MPHIVTRTFRAAPAAAALAFGLVVAPTFWSASLAHAQYEKVDSWTESVKTLERTTRYNRDGTHHAMLTALRKLKDPNLKPLFQALVQSEHWSMQINGIFGLAELDAKTLIDPFLLSQISNVDDRSAAIAAAVQLGMVDRPQAETILAWTDLTPRDIAILVAETVHRRGAADIEASKEANAGAVSVLTPLLTATSPDVVGIAAFALSTLGVPAADAGYGGLAKQLQALPLRDRNATIATLAGAATTFRLTGAIDFLEEQLETTTLSPEARLACVDSLLRLSPERGYTAWAQSVKTSPLHSLRVRLGLLLLSSDVPLPANAGQPLRTAAAAADAPDDPILSMLASAIDSLSVGTAATELPALVATGHVPSMSAVLLAAKRLDTDSQRATYAAFFELLKPESRDRMSAAAIDVCLDAISRLAQLDVAAVAKMFDESDPADGTIRDLLLLAMAGADTSDAAKAAFDRRAVAGKRTASLVLVAYSRYAPSLSPADAEELGHIAAGGSPLEGPLQAQAAWLFARHTSREDKAIAALLAAAATRSESPTGGADANRRE
ncbi:MAG: hypothetical protein JNM94_09620 [Phycisphaerae bacterium]|nr:hypothetical protein [Phycisphaerae bacterium]